MERKYDIYIFSTHETSRRDEFNNASSRRDVSWVEENMSVVQVFHRNAS